jgi:3-oxoacyl-[acyl-carrier protein] reductase
VTEKKVALITGGATGIGRSVALGLARAGINVAINYSRSENDATTTVADIKALGVDAVAIKADVSVDADARQLVSSAVSSFGRLDYVVNSAGTTVYVAMADLEGLQPEHWDQIMDVNVKGMFWVCRAAAPHLKATRGSIVNITSIAGMTGMGSSIAYAASKAAAICVTKSLARTLAPEVRVNSVAPGIVMTRWVDGREDHVRRLGEHTPLGRVCDAEDVAAVVIPVLTSASMMTGQTVVVDGGAFM